MGMQNFWELPVGTRKADSVLEYGKEEYEGEYWGTGINGVVFEAVSTEREDGSRFLLTDKVWVQGSGDAVTNSREGIRRIISREADGLRASVLVAEAEKSGETPDGRFERLAEKIAQITVDLLLYAGGKPRVKKFLQDGANPFVERRDGIEVDKVTSGLDVSLYNYELRYIPDFAHFSGRFQVGVKQYDAMMERAKWVKRLEEAVSAKVLTALEEEFLDDGINFSNLKLEVKLSEDGKCSLNASPKNAVTRGCVG